MPCREIVSTHNSVDGCLTDSPGRCDQMSNYASVVCFDEKTQIMANNESKSATLNMYAFVN